MRSNRIRVNCDNAGLDDAVRQQVEGWTIQPPVDKSGHPAQVDGPLVFAFDTTIANPIPQLNDAEVRAQATEIVEPVWPKNGVAAGVVISAQVSVDEKGSLAGIGFPSMPKEAAGGVGAVMTALRKWQFRPRIRDGKPQYFHGTVLFTVK